MPRFTFDVESAELSVAECMTFSEVVKYTCREDERRRLSTWLAGVSAPQPASVCDFAQRQARQMWRTEVRLK